MPAVIRPGPRDVFGLRNCHRWPRSATNESVDGAQGTIVGPGGLWRRHRAAGVRQSWPPELRSSRAGPADRGRGGALANSSEFHAAAASWALTVTCLADPETDRLRRSLILRSGAGAVLRRTRAGACGTRRCCAAPWSTTGAGAWTGPTPTWWPWSRLGNWTRY
jgi:hypothetical protein